MAIQSVPNLGQSRSEELAKAAKGNSAAGKNGAAGGDAEGKGLNQAAVYDGAVEAANAKTYTRDTATLEEIGRQVEAKLATLRATVERLITEQGAKAGVAQGLTYDQLMKKYDGKLKEFFENLQVDEETRLQAQQEISENGFWGVKQTSERILDFAKALSGGDPSKLGLLRNAIEQGYKAAEKAWGGELPEICKKTQEAVLKGLDEMAQPEGDTAGK